MARWAQKWRPCANRSVSLPESRTSRPRQRNGLAPYRSALSFEVPVYVSLNQGLLSSTKLGADPATVRRPRGVHPVVDILETYCVGGRFTDNLGRARKWPNPPASVRASHPDTSQWVLMCDTLRYYPIRRSETHHLILEMHVPVEFRSLHAYLVSHNMTPLPASAARKSRS